MQKKYKNLKQNVTKKIKKYIKRFNLIFACFEISKRQNLKNKF